MSRRIIHICQSVDGALKNWSEKTWKAVGADNGLTARQMKKTFELYKHEGKKVIPFEGIPCEGFSYVDGCPGHSVEEKENA